LRVFGRRRRGISCPRAFRPPILDDARGRESVEPGVLSPSFQSTNRWIAHVKELNTLVLRSTHNRRSSKRIDLCPLERRAAIENALRHFRIL